jgi:hypothetical protein
MRNSGSALFNMTDNIESRTTPKPTAAVVIVTWICVAALSFIVLIIPVGVAVGIFFMFHRQNGWGTQKDSFPLLVVTHDNGKPIAHVTMYRDLASFPSSSDWTFLVKRDEREAVINQVRAKHDESGTKEGSFEAISVAFQDRSDGQLEVHLLASRYIDSHNESWYIAHDKSITPLARRQHADIGVGIAAAFAAPLPTAILSAIIASFFVFRRSRRSSR